MLIFFFLGGGTISSAFRHRIVGNVVGNAKVSIGNPYESPDADHGEEGAEKHRWEEVETGIQIII